MTEKLKPCPFCGGKAIFEENTGTFFIHCESCCAFTPDFNTKEQAIKAWNDW